MMEKGKRWSFTKKNCIYTFVLTFLFLALVVPMIQKTTMRSYTFRHELKGEWTVSLGNAVYADVDLQDLRFTNLKKGDVIICSRKLPNWNLSSPVLQLLSMHAYTKVYLDEMLIFDFGHADENEERLPGYGLCTIELPAYFAGKQLEIEYTLADDLSVEEFQTPYLINGTYRVQNLASENRSSIMIGIFLVILGAIGMLLSLIMIFQNIVFLRIFWLSAFSYTIGIWSLCVNGNMLLFFTNISAKSYMEYISFYFMGIPFVLYFYDRVFADKMPKWFKAFYSIYVVFQMLFFVIVMAFHYNDIVHFPAFVMTEHIILAILLIFVVMLLFLERKYLHQFDWKTFVGFAVASVLAMAEIIRYNFGKYIFGFKGNHFFSYLGVGVLIVVGTLFLDFSRKITQALRRDTRNQLLQKMAYNDDLTGLTNRRRFEEYMRDLEKRKAKYSIVSIDMNLLKAINDTFGHEAGDKALKSFAEVLTLIFPPESVICRTGGDEFVVFVDTIDKERILDYIHVMLDEMERRNATNDITLSAAYGCAYSYENENPRIVYKLADQRMYACKKEMHMERQ